MTKETIETIRFALRFLRGVNESIVFASDSPKRKEKAYEDIRKDCDALADFEAFIVRHVICGVDR